ncbi:2-haloalkanoic acid dehalogenase [Cladobotryum mycophilum]|uniref:2-haloalkanoic acid dehalogenase n=1 Tax=Cladobotryum mycophilum TaxID=491253 RepID=A0ABR0STX3_9HYPO
MKRTIVAFDLYGTLLSTDSIVREIENVCDKDKAKEIATQARRYQLEYTWRISSMASGTDMRAIIEGLYQPFDELTRWSFLQASAEAGVDEVSAHLPQIMEAYNKLDTFPEVEKAFSLLSQHSSIEPYIFSNGTRSMITSSVRSAAAFSRASAMLPDARIVSVDPLGVYKPDPRTYGHLVETAQMEEQRGSVWLVSSNPFDIVGARRAGLEAVWVNRSGKEWSDGLGGATGLHPSRIVQGVDEAVKGISDSVSE